MTKYPSSKTARRAMLCAASALGLAFVSSSAFAAHTDGDRATGDRYYQRDSDDVVVTAPRPRNEHSIIGAPIRTVGLSRDVRSTISICAPATANAC